MPIDIILASNDSLFQNRTRHVEPWIVVVRKKIKCTPTVVLALLCILLGGQYHPAAAQHIGGGAMSGNMPLKTFLTEHPEESARSLRFYDRVSKNAVPIAGEKRPVHIAIVTSRTEYSEHWRRSIAALRARLGELQVPFTIAERKAPQDRDMRRQTHMVLDALASDPDYLIFMLDSFRQRSLIERLVSRSRPKVILQNITTPVREWGKAQPFLYVGFDHEEGTRLLIDHYVESRPEHERFAIFYGEPGFVSRARGETFRTAMLKRTDKTLAATYFVGFDREKARTAALSLLGRDDRIGFIYACSTEIALGVSEAIEQLGLVGKVATNGWGGGSEELELIARGRLTATAMRMDDDSGVAIAEAIALDQSGRRAEVPPVYAGTFALVTSKDPRQRIEQLKRRAYRYSQ
jgi:autoinducer 2-binding protein LuxP